MRRGIAAVVLGLVLAGAAGVATAASTSCGQMLVAPNGRIGAVWSRNQVSVTGASCAQAKALVRAWDHAAQAARIPEWVLGPTNRQHVLELGHFSPPYRFAGYTCRWMDVRVPGSAYLGGRGRCRGARATIDWTYRAALNPAVGRTTGCAKGVAFRHGDAATIRVRGISCPSARGVLLDALNHGVIAPGPGGLHVAHRTRRGFAYSRMGSGFAARRGTAHIAFNVCWFNVNC